MKTDNQYRPYLIKHIALAFAAALLTHDALSAQPSSQAPYPHATEPIGSVRQIYDGALTPDMAVNTFRNIDRLFPVRTVPRSDKPMPLPPAATPLKIISLSDDGKRYGLEDYLELNRVSGLLILQDSRIKLERYRYGNTERTRWMSMSIRNRLHQP